VTSQLSKQLGECIRELRLQTGQSQVVFGERCGFYQTYLSRIENGRANPTLNAIEVIANTLGMTVFELFDRVREKVPRGKKPGATTKPVKKAVKKRKGT
jgi:transcriptional regulator with XRE-family HTH domain